MTEGSPTLKDHSASSAMRILDALASSMLCIFPSTKEGHQAGKHVCAALWYNGMPFRQTLLILRSQHPGAA